MSHLKLYCPDVDEELSNDNSDSHSVENVSPSATGTDIIPSKGRFPADDIADEFPHTIPFDRAARFEFPQSRRAAISTTLERARAIHANQNCPYCQHATVDPIELGDAIISPRNHRPIPGSATVVGFHCHSCGHEWPVYKMSHESA